MNRPKICAVIVNNDLKAIEQVTPLVDLFEVRIDLVGTGWQELAGQLGRPWIACNRRVEEGGVWRGSEDERVEELLRAVTLGADIVDVELETKKLGRTVKLIKTRAKCLLSCHNLTETPPLDKMKEIIKRQIEAGADICKLVTTARSFGDNLAVLQLIKDFPQKSVVAFAAGALGAGSRILCPLLGGGFTYASIEEGKESAPGQITARDLNMIYGMLNDAG